jgi:DNA-binding transcriptional LysR family regulator
MDLRQLSYFVAVAEEAQFTRAAVRVSVAQPAISAQIGRLERELGEPLFHRDPRAARLTEAGEALLPHARAALAAAERGRASVASLRGLLHGRLRVGVSGPVDARLAAALGDFRGAHPAIEVSLRNDHNAPLLAAVAAGDVDAAVVGLGAQPVPPEVAAEVIAEEPVVVAMRRGHALSRRRTIALAALAEEPLVALPPGSGQRALLEDSCREAGYAPRIAAEAGDLASLMRLAEAGLGVAIAPRSAVPEGAALAVAGLTRPDLRRRTALAWNAAATSPAGRAFLALARERFA